MLYEEVKVGEYYLWLGRYVVKVLGRDEECQMWRIVDCSDGEISYTTSSGLSVPKGMNVQLRLF